MTKLQELSIKELYKRINDNDISWLSDDRIEKRIKRSHIVREKTRKVIVINNIEVIIKLKELNLLSHNIYYYSNNSALRTLVKSLGLLSKNILDKIDRDLKFKYHFKNIAKVKTAYKKIDFIIDYFITNKNKISSKDEILKSFSLIHNDEVEQRHIYYQKTFLPIKHTMKQIKQEIGSNLWYLVSDMSKYDHHKLAFYKKMNIDGQGLTPPFIKKDELYQIKPEIFNLIQ